MSSTWNEEIFEEFTKLHRALKDAKKAKNHEQAIAICKNIIELDSRAKFMQIMVPIFLKETGSAYLKLNRKEDAVEYFKLARTGYIEHRSRGRLNKPDDWLKDIAHLEKSILKLGSTV